jgi:hypothetical protein
MATWQMLMAADSALRLRTSSSEVALGAQQYFFGANRAFASLPKRRSTRGTSAPARRA